MAPPVTDFAVKEKYTYLNGLGNYHSSEAFPGANPLVNNTPQKPAYGLRTERISGSSFTAPRDANLQTWLYRTTSSLDHDGFIPHSNDDNDDNDDAQKSTPQPASPTPTFLSPNSYLWPTFPPPSATLKPIVRNDWLSQRLLARNGDPATKTGLAIWIFSISEPMRPNTAFSSLDGDALIIPQSGALDIQTELGWLLVRQNEICVIPRGIRYRVGLVADAPVCRGYVCELFQGHFQLPNLGPVGSTGLANVRDFQVPVAWYDGGVVDGVARPSFPSSTSSSSSSSSSSSPAEKYTIISRQANRLWRTTQTHTPFDVAAWHGTNYPFKYDLARFCVLGNVLFDEHDPSLYTVLTAPSVVDFAIIPPRWQVAEDTFWLPYYHRNTMSEFYAPVVTCQERAHPLNAGGGDDDGKEFRPFMAGLNGSMVTHGPAEPDFKHVSTMALNPTKLMTDGITLVLLETEVPLLLSDWAVEAAVMNGKRGDLGKKDNRDSKDKKIVGKGLVGRESKI